MRARFVGVALGIAIVAVAIWLWRGAKDRVEGQERRDANSAAEAPPPEAPGLATSPTANTDRAAGKEPATESPEEAAEEGADPAARGGRSLEVVTVDAATGARVDGRWSLVAAKVVVSAGEDPSTYRLGPWEQDSKASGERIPGALSGDGVAATIHVRPPVGYVVFDDAARISAVFAADVRDVLAVVPLHREAVLDVRVLGPDGRPALGAALVALEVAGRTVHPITEAIRPGEFRVRGIPHLPGEPVAGGLSWGNEGKEDLEVAPEEGIASPEISTTVPADPAGRWSVVVHLSGPVSHLRDHLETDWDYPVEEAFGPVAQPGAPRGRVRVRALDWQGRPAKGASVLAQPVDERGEVTLTDLPVEEVILHMSAPGRFPAAESVFVKADATTEAVVREPVGARLDVTVVDDEGRPRPFAAVRVDARTFDVGESGQRIDRFTDANGRRTLARVEPGETEVYAQWGTRHGKATVRLRDGERTAVRIVAK